LRAIDAQTPAWKIRRQRRRLRLNEICLQTYPPINRAAARYHSASANGM
jgi:hypothetical protein